jgi:hypothetical protein
MILKNTTEGQCAEKVSFRLFMIYRKEEQRGKCDSWWWWHKKDENLKKKGEGTKTLNICR